MTSDWKLAWRNLGRNRRRNLATSLSIGVGFYGVILMSGYLTITPVFLEKTSIYLRRMGDISIYHEGGLERYSVKPREFSLSKADQDAIGVALERVGKEVGGSQNAVDFVGRYLKGVGLLSNGCQSVPFMGTGVDLDAERLIRKHPEMLNRFPEMFELIRGRGPWELASEPGAIVVAPGLARLIGKPKVLEELNSSEASQTNSSSLLDCAQLNIASRIASEPRVQLIASTLRGDLGGVDATISAHVFPSRQELEDMELFGSLQLFQRLFETDAVTYLGVFLKVGTDRKRFLQLLNSEFKARGVPAKGYLFSSPELNPNYVGIMGFLRTLALFIGSIVFGVVVLTIVNLLTLSLAERSKEIGSMRALGFGPQRIAGLVLKETLILSTLSISIATALGGLTIQGINALEFKYNSPGEPQQFNFEFIFSPVFAAELACFFVLVCAITAYLFGIRRARKSIVELLGAAGGGL